MRTTAIFIICCVFMAACEKDVTVNLPQGEEQLVVEGTIENDRYPEVILTRSLNYFSHITVDQLIHAFVHNATVTVSDGARTMQLKEFSRDTINGVKWYYYSADTSLADAFKGEPGGRYTLRITVTGETYEGVTTIPGSGMVLDSLWSHLSSSNPGLARLQGVITDPPERGNYVRYKTARNGGIFRPGINSTIDDQIVNGATFSIQLDAGHDRTQQIDYDTYGYFRAGDSVRVMFSRIDKATFDFWRTLDFAFASNGNVFSSPLQVRGNIEGALGYWGGYATSYRSIRLVK